MTGDAWLMATGQQTSIAEKLRAQAVELLSLPAMMSRGSSSGDDSVFVLQRTPAPGKYLTVDGETVALEDDALRIPLFATDFNRYRFTPRSEKVIVFPYRREQTGSMHLMAEATLKSEYPETHRYLVLRRKRLEERKQYKAWYGLRPRPEIWKSMMLRNSWCPCWRTGGSMRSCRADRARYCLMAGGGLSITVDAKSDLSAALRAAGC